LFLDRTRRARPGFRLTDQNADAVLQICRRLDGLPLALELAAARLRTLEPETLLPKLAHALDVLTAGARDLPPRQRTLRATIDWSHSLLSAAEQRLFRRLSVFAGNWRHEAVAPVCFDGEPDHSLDGIESLVEKGLVHQLADRSRFGILETIREYAAERLAESGEEARVRRQHAEYYRALAEQLYADFRTPAQLESLRQGDVESANLEAALDHLHPTALRGDARACESGLRLCSDLWMYWHIRGLHLRARQRCRAFLELPASQSYHGARARVLFTASVASMTLGDVPGALAECQEAEALTPGSDLEAGTLIGIAFGVTYLTAGDIAAARPWLEEAVRRGRQADLKWELGLSLGFLGIVESVCGNGDVARALFDEALAIQRPIGDRQGLGTALGGIAALEAAAGRPEQALAYYREALTAYDECGDRPEEARILDAIAWTALSMERADEARQYFAESLRAYEDVGSVRGIGIALLGLAATWSAEGHFERAVRIGAAAEAFSQQLGVANDYAKHTAAPRYMEAAREAVDAAGVARLEVEGRAMSLREAVRYALARDEEAVELARP
jgi:tetratricopeptide (TPR) repeat protein